MSHPIRLTSPALITSPPPRSPSVQSPAGPFSPGTGLLRQLCGLAMTGWFARAGFEP